MSRASHRLKKYLKVAPTADHCIPLSFAGAEVTIGELQQILDERAEALQILKSYRAAARVWEETIAELQEQLQQVKLNASSPSRREMRLQEKLNALGTDEAIAQMCKRAREAADAWREVPLQDYQGMSLSEVIALMRQQIAGATGKATIEHAHANRLESQLGSAQERIRQYATFEQMIREALRATPSYRDQNPPREGTSRDAASRR